MKFTDLIESQLNHLCAELLWENIKIYQYFLWFLETEEAQVVEIRHHESQGPT